MKVDAQNLPSDFYRPDVDVAVAYQQEAGSESEARFRRMDLTYAVYLDELPKGKAGVGERIAQRLQLDTNVKSARTTIGDAIRIFETFRLSGEQGLGFSREKLRSIPFSRLRALAQNRNWALKNRDKVDEALSIPENGKYTIRDYISDHTPEEERRSAKREPEFVDRKLRMTAEDASGFDDLIAAVRNKMTTEGIPLSEHESTALSQIVLYALTDWLQADQLVYDENGRVAVSDDGMITTMSNINYFPQPDNFGSLHGAAD